MNGIARMFVAVLGNTGRGIDELGNVGRRFISESTPALLQEYIATASFHSPEFSVRMLFYEFTTSQRPTEGAVFNTLTVNLRHVPSAGFRRL